MVNKPKIIGTKGETRVVNYLEAAGLKARRNVLHGSNDEGDIIVSNIYGDICLLEVKSGKQTAHYTRQDKEDWLQQTRTEVSNSKDASIGFLVIAKHNANESCYEVWSVGGQNFWYLDEFATALGGEPKIFRGGKPIE